VTGTTLLVFSGGAGVELVGAGLLEVSTAVDVVVEGAAVTEGEELSTDDPGEADVEVDVEAAEVGMRVSEVRGGFAEAQEHTALAEDWTSRPVTGPHAPRTQLKAALMMAADADEEHWQP